MSSASHDSAAAPGPQPTPSRRWSTTATPARPNHPIVSFAALSHCRARALGLSWIGLRRD